MPMPISACGASVQYGSAPGSRPSPASPPASATAPAAMPAVVCSTPRVSSRASTVQTGIAETISAASSGDRAQPSVSMITSRNSAPVRPAESSVERQFRRQPQPSSAPLLGRRPRRPERRRDRQDHRHLHDEDRFPADQLREQSAHRRPDRDADQPGRAPRRGRLLVRAAAARQQLDRARDHARPGHPLRAASDDQHGDRGRERAQQGGGREHEHAAAPHRRSARRAAARRQSRRAQHGERQRQIERRQHPRDLQHRANRTDAGCPAAPASRPTSPPAPARPCPPTRAHGRGRVDDVRRRLQTSSGNPSAAVLIEPRPSRHACARIGGSPVPRSASGRCEWAGRRRPPCPTGKGAPAVDHDGRHVGTHPLREPVGGRR